MGKDKSSKNQNKMAVAADSYHLDIDGLDVEVCRKDILHLHIHVNPPYGDVVAAVPLDMDDAVVVAFVRTRRAWINRQVKTFDDRNWTDARQFISGETIWIFGRQCFLKVVEDDSMSFDYSGSDAVLHAPADSSVEERADFVYGVLRKELKERIDKMMDSVVAATGIEPNQVVVERRGTRWSSCNRKTNNIFVNAMLVHHPQEALHLVLVYECLHLQYNPSTKAFQEKLEAIVPGWQTTLGRMNKIPIPRE